MLFGIQRSGKKRLDYSYISWMLIIMISDYLFKFRNFFVDFKNYYLDNVEKTFWNDFSS